ncbi:DNA-binding transcriptional MerR regulator [Paenibacillus sp. SORGH_AS306]|uniref:MerR family transcriptional regulator n=1 Tax=unclassified Paenibacillus TaxID=185978 RepID=UPI00278A9E58|nr:MULTISPECIES: MerR family transcriptional regulator [unclassified Paenibacillus]MDQ1236144.1 DNA-binding transcriptional MerR regulator [Paenibacillus sp. SORGH_AS_0306]MDR6108499.1 DNA-binding transcriptional MerR regulator [Paenibacillus sp. SORGH_AS_0338]
MLKINELSKRLGISTRTIRFYEQHGLLPSVQREHNQYRIFGEEDIWRLQTIIALREAGMAIKEIKQALEPQGLPDSQRLRYYLKLQRSLLTTQWLEMKRMAETTEQMIHLLQTQQTLPIQEIYHLADQAKHLRELRQNWQDQWDFDQRAITHDQDVHTRREEYPHYEQALTSTATFIHATAGEHGLDLGIGTGNLAGKLVASGVHMSGVDQSQEMLKQCQHKFPMIETRIGNMLAIPYPDDHFHFVVSSFTFRHLNQQQQLLALTEIHRVLKPHGRLCLTDRLIVDQAVVEDSLIDSSANDLEHQSAYHHQWQHPALQQWFEEHGYITKYHTIEQEVGCVLAVSLH